MNACRICHTFWPAGLDRSLFMSTPLHDKDGNIVYSFRSIIFIKYYMYLNKF